ncbi:MAG TPA: uracil phosphoribosyltransferase [Pirellulales bacterium]|jgi:uracil phosphoribosyltransferase|nr:uracil phosphoribosyltransferase [Pirellulales bacterium]
MTTAVESAGSASRSGAVIELDHPLVGHHLARLRDVSTPAPEFRLLVQRLAVLLTYEATKDLAVKPIQVQTPLATTTGQTIGERIALVPILRAGLGMVDPILNLIPEAQVWHLGIYRDEETLQPVEYYSRLPAGRPVDVALVLDPMLATGGSALAALGALRNWGVPSIKVLSIIAARDGIAEVEGHFPNVQFFVGAIDPLLNAQKYIVPGLGDAGDRTFNTLARE